MLEKKNAQQNVCFICFFSNNKNYKMKNCFLDAVECNLYFAMSLSFTQQLGFYCF